MMTDGNIHEMCAGSSWKLETWIWRDKHKLNQHQKSQSADTITIKIKHYSFDRDTVEVERFG